MTQKAAVTLVLLGLAVASGAALALGVGRPPRPENPGVVEIREEARNPGRALFSERLCVSCHGADGGGKEMGPGLGAVMSEYLAAAGGNEAEAKARLIAYLKDPKGSPRLRKDTTHYPNPMPSAKGLGFTDDESIAQVADYVLHMKPPSMAVGGDAQGR